MPSKKELEDYRDKKRKNFNALPEEVQQKIQERSHLVDLKLWAMMRENFLETILKVNKKS